MTEIRWADRPADHDYPAAESYLSLIFCKPKVTGIVDCLHSAPMTTFKAKDIFRASGLSLLGISNSHVNENIKKIRKGRPLSPILLVRDEKNGRVIVADGYHRLCAVYTFDEDIEIPCKIV